MSLSFFKGPINFYWNFVTNERFQVLVAIINQQPVSQCLREVSDSTTQTSVIQPNTLIIKPSILFNDDNYKIIHTTMNTIESM